MVNFAAVTPKMNEIIQPMNKLQESEAPSTRSTPDEFENRDFTLKMHQMFSVHTTPEKFENATITCDVVVFEKTRFQNTFHPD